MYTQRRVNSVQERDDQLREFNVILSRLITKFTTIVKCRRTGQVIAFASQLKTVLGLLFVFVRVRLSLRRKLIKTILTVNNTIMNYLFVT